MTGSPINLFTYGTLLIPEVMQAVTGRKFPSGDAVLNGYCRYSIKNRVYPAVIARAGASVHGRIYSELDRHTLEILDEFEGIIYTRCTCEVIINRDRFVDAQAYVISEAHRHMMSDAPWSLDEFMRNHLGSYLAKCNVFSSKHNSNHSALVTGGDYKTT